MKKSVSRFVTVGLVVGVFAAVAPIAQTQGAAQAQKLAAIAKQLNLTPPQKTQVMPILEADAPKLEAIKSNTSLGPLQKMEQLTAIHAQSDSQIKSILNPQQYQQLQQIRQEEIQQAMEKKRAQQ
jgi:Spy/CpxP family protein refolding chaperone